MEKGKPDISFYCSPAHYKPVKAIRPTWPPWSPLPSDCARLLGDTEGFVVDRAVLSKIRRRCPRARRECSVSFKAVEAVKNPAAGKPTESTSDTVALLRDLEALLVGQLCSLEATSYRQRLEIEAELSEVRRQLARVRVAPSK
jgi:hypothetical protein